MPHLAITCFSAPRITLDDQPLPVAYAHVRALLLYLAVESQRPHERSALAALLWPDQPDAVARKNLRQALATLRQALNDSAPTPWLLVTPSSLQWNSASAAWCDAHAFAARLQACARHACADPVRCEQCAEHRRAAVDLYGGPFLQHVALRNNDLFDEWLLVTREQFHLQALGALEHLAAYHAATMQYEALVQVARRWLALDPLCEAAHRYAMRALAMTGQRTAALEQYQRCCALLHHELGIAPDAATTALWQQLRAEEPPAAPPPGFVPLPPTPLIGRAPELATINAMLDRADGRLVTLTGTAGIGKTRLSLAVAAAQQGRFADGVWFVPLDAITNPALVLPAIAHALHITDQPEQTPLHGLAAALRDRHMLLVLDNFEQVVAAAAQVGELLARCPRLTVLVTSRERLRLRAEQHMPLAPLALPAATNDVAAMAQAAAMAFFVDRAQAVVPSFQLTPHNAATISAICARLDGLPLAIELVAPFVASTAPADLLAQVEQRLLSRVTGPRDLPERQRTLQSAVRWSYDLLGPLEQQVFRRLGVFVDGWTLASAAAVCFAPDDSQAAPAAHSAIATLIDASMVVAHSRVAGRATMLATLREWALRALEHAGEWADVARRHAQAITELAEHAAPHLAGDQQSVWLQQLGHEHENARAALQWALEHGEPVLAARLAAALARFWRLRGFLVEGQRWLEAVLLHAAHFDPALHAQVLEGYGGILWMRGDLLAAEEANHASLALYQQLHDLAGVARLLNGLGVVAGNRRDYARAADLYRQSLAMHVARGDLIGQAFALNNLGMVALEQGDHARAVALFEQCLAIERRLGNQLDIADTLNNLGMALLEQGNHARAARLYHESIALRQPLGEQAGLAECLEGLAAVAALRGQGTTAARLWGTAEAQRERFSTPLPPSEQVGYRRFVSIAQRHTTADVFARAWQTGRSLPLPLVLAELGA